VPLRAVEDVAVSERPFRVRMAGAPVDALHRVDAARARASTALRLEAPSSLALGDGRVWVVDAFGRTLRRAGLR